MLNLKLKNLWEKFQSLLFFFLKSNSKIEKINFQASKNFSILPSKYRKRKNFRNVQETDKSELSN